MNFAAEWQAEGYANADGVIARDYKAEVLFRQAGRLRERYAPAPDPLPDPDDYSEAAADCEAQLFARLYENDGSYKSLTYEGDAVTYEGLEAVLAVVRDAMGKYASGGGEPSTHTAHIGVLPW